MCKEKFSVASWALILLFPLVVSCGNRQSVKDAATLPAEEKPSETAIDMSQYMPSLSAGVVAPDFVANDTLGNAFQLSSLKGSFVVVDFWASWCGDCRREIPAVKELYAEFAPRGINFVGLSFDHDAEAWRKCLAESDFPFLQVSNLVKWKESPISAAYDLHWIPTLALISPEGTLVGFAFTASDMRSLLEKIS